MMDVILGLVFIAFSGLVYLLTRGFPPATVMEGLGPGFMPGLVILILTGLSLLLIVSGLTKRRKAGTAVEAGAAFSVSELKAPGILMAAVIAYLVLLKHFGFLLTTPLLMLATMKLMGAKTRFAMVMAVVLTGAVYALFVFALRVMLPRGSLF